MRKYIILLSLFIIFLAQASWALTPWTTTLKANFDHAESFDDIQDYPVSSGDAPYIVQQGVNNTYEHLPKYQDDTPSIMNEYQWYVGYVQPQTDWIADHRASGGKVWLPNGGNGKSICWDMSNRQSTGLADGITHGPSKIGFMISGGDRTSGYSEAYVFFMVYFPRNYWPTSRDVDRIGSYVDGSNYMYVASTKTCQFAIGFTGPNTFADYAAWPDNYTSAYGWASRVLHIKPSNPYSNPNCLGGTFDGRSYLYNPDPPPPFASDEDTAVTSMEDQSPSFSSTFPAGQWMGVEVHYKMNTHNNNDGIWEVKYIDPSNPVGTTVISRTEVWFNPGTKIDAGDKFNEFHFGTNNSAQWQWGPTMDPKAFIDDVIIDGASIYERYFELLDGETLPTYDAPTITGPADFSTTESSVEIEGTYTVAPDLPDQAVIITWTLGGNYGFAVAALGSFSCTVPNLVLGANSIVFEITDSNSGTGSDTTVVMRTAPPISSTSTIHGYGALKNITIH